MFGKIILKSLNLRFITFILVVFFTHSFFAQQAVTKNKPSEANTTDANQDAGITKKEDELARVSILPFEDRTRSTNFQYMAESLGDAINISMIKEFSYNKVETADVKKAIYDIQQEIIKENLKKPASKKAITPGPAAKKEAPKKTGNAVKDKDNAEKEVVKVKSEEEIILDNEQLALVKKVAKKLSSDIVIFGNYSYDNETNEIVFTVKLYLALSDDTRELDETRNAVDNTLFKSTRNVARKLVSEIRTMIEEAEEKSNQQSGKSTDTAETEKKDTRKPGEKMALTKKVAMGGNFDWSSKKVSISLAPGFFFNTLTDTGCGTCQLGLSLSSRFWLIPNLYLGLVLNAGGIENGAAPFFNGKPDWLAFDGLAFIGVALPANRWLFTADIGGGYFIVNNNTFGLAYNPAFGARIGAEVLLSPTFSLGLSLNAHMYYDEPKPLIFGGASLMFSIIL